MRVLLILLIPLIAACATIKPALSPPVSVGDPSGTDIAGRWRGTWTGTGIFNSAREDDVTINFVQRGDMGLGRLVLEGTTAAESVPETVRYQGLNGIRVVAQISKDTVTLRHQLDGRLFTADLKVIGEGEQMFGFVRGANPRVGLLLTRADRKAPEARPAPVPQPVAPAQSQSKQDPESVKDAVAMAPAPQPERPEREKEAERPRQEKYMAVQELPAIHFDFDKATLRPDAADMLMSHAAWLKDHGDTALLIEGHCDERGTAEYNIALGDRRAEAVKDYLSAYGIASERLSTISYGKERAACGAATEQCHEENRRAEFRVKSR